MKPSKKTSDYGVGIRVELPMVPNYLRIRNHPTGSSVDIADVSDKDLKALAAEWAVALLGKASHRRSPREDNPTRAPGEGA